MTDLLNNRIRMALYACLLRGQSQFEHGQDYTPRISSLASASGIIFMSYREAAGLVRFCLRFQGFTATGNAIPDAVRQFGGIQRHIGADDQDILRIELTSDESVKTSEIEGGMLDRDSVQSSLRHQFGLGAAMPA